MIIAINYADEKYKNAQRLNSKTACRGGGALSCLNTHSMILIQNLSKNTKSYGNQREEQDIGSGSHI